MKNNKEATHVCVGCGLQYLTEKQKKEEDSIVTFTVGDCDLCGELRPLTHIRAYNYLVKPNINQKQQ